MSNEDDIGEMLQRRASRAIRAILEEKERALDDLIEEADSEALRRVVLNEVNDLVSLAKVLVASVADDSRELNALFMEKLEEIHQSVVV